MSRQNQLSQIATKYCCSLWKSTMSLIH